MPGSTATPAGGGLRYGTGAGRWVLAATVLGSAVASIDATAVSVALPTIGREFDTSLAALQWVVTAYALTLSGLLLLGGALGDRYGRRRIFLIGVAWFALASLVCGVAPNAVVLIAARALQGIGAALLTPGSLAILQASFHPDDRSKAIGAWSGLSGVGVAIGPFLGGWLVDAASWRLIFVINIPVAAVVVLLGVLWVPESRDPRASDRMDTAGAALITTGLIGLAYGLIEGPVSGWTSPAVISALVCGAGLLVLFVLWERRTRAAMVPLYVFRSTQFTATNVVTLIVYGALGGAMFLVPIQLQQVAGYTALAAGVSLLPVTMLMLALSASSGALATRIGPRLQLSVGPVIIGAGLGLLTRVGPSGNYVTETLPAVTVLGFGLAATVAPLTATVLAAVPDRHAGIASAINNDVARAAALIAVAALPAAAGITGTAYLNPAQFSAGFHAAALISAVLCVLAGACAAATIRNPARVPERQVIRARHRVHCGLDAPAPPAAPAADR